ncbi:MAG: DUF4292 domain-containing protein [Bacteroidales bacterium]|nr:DUF4292 domain-containing protein [Bacteroidales bacterium]
MVKKIASFFCFFLSLTLLNAQEEQKKDFVFQNSDSAVVAITDSLDLISVPYDWITYQMRASVTTSYDQKSVQIYFVNRIDSIIYLNINLFGIELARAVAKPDSFVFVNKLESTYYSGGYEWLSKKIGSAVDFYMIQSVFNARDFAGFEDSLQLVENETTVHLIAPQRKHRDYDLTVMQELFLNPDNTIMTNDITDLKTKQSLVVNYDNYTLQSDVNFFSTLKIELEQAGIEVSAEIRNVKFNTPGPTRIKIPEKFEPLN